MEPIAEIERRRQEALDDWPGGGPGPDFFWRIPRENPPDSDPESVAISATMAANGLPPQFSPECFAGAHGVLRLSYEGKTAGQPSDP